MKQFIAVWCECDIQGSFGAGNSQECLQVDTTGLVEADIDKLVLDYVVKHSGCTAKEIDAMHGWEFIDVKMLNKFVGAAI